MPISDFMPATAQPQSASLDKLEVALRPATGSPVFAQVPILGEVKLTPSGTIQNYDAYADSADGAFQYAVKTGIGGTLTFRTAANEKNATVSSLIQASLKSGPGANILARITRGSGAVYTAEVALQQFDPMSSARGIAETAFSGTVNGLIEYAPPV